MCGKQDYWNINGNSQGEKYPVYSEVFTDILSNIFASSVQRGLSI